jgi:hypothetical protein
LVENRVCVLLFGGSESDRVNWAAEAASYYVAEGPLTEVKDAAALSQSVNRNRGVVYVPDFSRYDTLAQRAVVNCMKANEERAKWILGLTLPPANARAKGLIREDVLYWLEKSKVDLSSSEAKEAIKKRRAKHHKTKR